jgi:hypothetical protein
MAKLLENKESYVRITDASGTPIIASSGALQVINPNLDSIIVASGNVCTNIQVMPVVGAQGNAWNNEAVLALGTSIATDCQYCANISVFGTSDSATTISVQVSQDGGFTPWIDTNHSVVLAGAGDFHFSFTSAVRYIRLKSSAPATLTATICGK